MSRSFCFCEDCDVDLCVCLCWRFVWHRNVACWQSLRLTCICNCKSSLRIGRSGDRIPVGDEILRTRPDRPWGPPSLHGYRVSNLRVKWPGCGFDHPPQSCAKFEEKEELYLYFPSVTSWPVVRCAYLLLQVIITGTHIKVFIQLNCMGYNG